MKRVYAISLFSPQAHMMRLVTYKTDTDIEPFMPLQDYNFVQLTLWQALKTFPALRISTENP